MQRMHYSRKKRQLHFLVKKLQALLSRHKEVIQRELEVLISKISKLARELAHVISHPELKKILGVAAIYIGISVPNQVSAQSFASPRLNPFGIISTYEVAIPTFADLDGDGDMDLLVGESYGAMQYFENTGTASEPKFAAPITNPFGIDTAYYLAFPAFADLDGDGDLDLMVGEYNDGDYLNGIQYYENIGSVTDPQFAEPQVNPFGLTFTYVWSFPAFADLDGDGDSDLLVGEYYGSFQYFENTGSATEPQFAAPQVNPFGLDTVVTYGAFPTLSDLDNDGDLDLLIGDTYGSLQYFENTGSATEPQFAPPQINPFGLVSTYDASIPTFVDLDNDGDHDLLVGEYGGAMQYFENTSTTATERVSQNLDIKIFPNPTSDLLTIQTNETIVRIEIINAAGQAVGVFKNNDKNIYLNHLPPGLYMVKFVNTEGHFTVRKIQKL